MHTYAYPRPAVTVDAVVIDISQPTNHILLIKRLRPPFADCWALPGGFVDENEALNAAAQRELAEETGLNVSVAELSEVGAFGAPHRDPRGWTISIAFKVERDFSQAHIAAADDASEAQWFSLDALPALAFDHAEIIGRSV